MAFPTIKINLDSPFDNSLEVVRRQLAAAGFGVITEIDMHATLRTKLGVEIAPEVILGACRPELAHRAITADPAVATLLPCNVVVRADGECTVVEAFDPAAISQFGPPAGRAAEALGDVAADARMRLVAALDSAAEQVN